MRGNSKLLSFITLAVAGATVMASETALNGSMLDRLGELETYTILRGSCSTSPSFANHSQTTIAPDSAEQGQTVEFGDEQITVHAEYVEYFENNRLELQGDIDIAKYGYQIRSDRAIIDQAKNQAELDGNIYISGPQMEMRSQRAEVNLNSEQARLHEAEFYSPESGYRGQAGLIDQADPMRLSIYDGNFTTCAVPEPDWSFEASTISFDQEEGFGEAKHVRFNIADVPVLYVPWFSFPIDDRRKSGFLFPEVGSSNAGGFYAATPYYLNLSPNYDATYTPIYIGGRGLHHDVEFRHVSEISDSRMSVSYIGEDKDYIDNQLTLGNTDESGKRWGFSLDQDWDLSAWSSHLSGDIEYAAISDNDYLQDLDQGVQIASSDMLERRARLEKRGNQYRVSVLLQENRSLNDNILPEEIAYQRLPEVSYQSNYMVGDFELDWGSRYSYFYRDNKDLSLAASAYGSRLRHVPKLSYPLRAGWGYVKPSLSIDHTDYLLQDYPGDDAYASRTMPIAELDAGLYFDRPARLLPANYSSSLEPRLYYVYTEDEFQNKLPNFDSSVPSFDYQNLFRSNRYTGGDRISGENRLTMSVGSRLTDWARGLDVVSLNLGHIYQFDDTDVSLTRGADIYATDSLFASEITLRPDVRWNIYFANLWDASEDETEESVSKVSYQSPASGWLLNLSHRYKKNDIEQGDTSLIYPVSQDIQLLGQWRYDLDANRTIGSLIGLEYTSCCWGIQLLGQNYLTDEGELDNAILFRFQLRGLGSFGVSDDKIDNLISGYQAVEEVL